MRTDLIVLTHLFALFSCAGPMDPFGANNSFNASANLQDNALFQSNKIYEVQPKSNLSFFPSRQVLHRESPLKIIIQEEVPIPETYELRLFYNGQEITKKFLKESKKEKSEDLLTMSFSYQDLKLMPAMDHDIVVAYRSSTFYPYKIYQYDLPSCSLRDTQKLREFDSFSPDQMTLDMIQNEALKQELNPALLTSLVAQESAFNPLALSTAKALGLTQVTNLASFHIIKKYNGWPTYKGLNDLSFIEIRGKIDQGDLNSQNDWRLDPKKSVIGGAYYINYLDNYWRKSLPEITDELRDDLVLASYNSGAFRVKQSLEDGSTDWLNHADLKQAKIYVNKIKSYCYHSKIASSDF